MKVTFLAYKSIKSKKDNKTYHLMEASDGKRSKEFFIRATDEEIDFLQSLSEGDEVDVQFDADPFKSDRLSVKSVSEV